MNLKQVTVQNFRNFYGKNIFDFSKKITIFLGDNGNGKSSIFDAIQWCLTGEIERYDISDAKIKDIIINNNVDNSECYVEVMFSNDTVVKRQVQSEGNISVCFKTPDGETIYGHQKVIEKILETLKIYEKDIVDNKQIFKIPFLMQDEILNFIVNDSQNERYNALSSLLGLNQITSLKQNLETVTKIISDKLASINNKNIEIKESISNYSSEIKNINIEKIDENLDYKDFVNRLSELETEKKSLTSYLERYNETVYQLKSLFDLKNANEIPNINKILENLELLERTYESLTEEKIRTSYSLDLKLKDLEIAEDVQNRVNSNKKIKKLINEINESLSESDISSNFIDETQVIKTINALQNKLLIYNFTLENLNSYSHFIKKQNTLNIEKDTILESIKVYQERNEKLYTAHKKLQNQFQMGNSDDLEKLIELINESYHYIEKHEEYQNSCPICNQPIENPEYYFENRLSMLIRKSKTTSDKLTNIIDQRNKVINEINDNNLFIQKSSKSRNILEDKIKLLANKISEIEFNHLYKKEYFSKSYETLQLEKSHLEKKVSENEEFIDLINKRNNLLSSIEKDVNIPTLEFNYIDNLNRTINDLKIKIEDLSNKENKLVIDRNKYKQEISIIKEYNKIKGEIIGKYQIEKGNSIKIFLNLYSQKVDEEIIKLNNELKDFDKISKYRQYKTEVVRLSAILTNNNSLKILYESKLNKLNEEIMQINDKYSFQKLLNGKNSVIQQYFNYLNPNVSVYRELEFVVSDENNTLDINVKFDNKSGRAVNVLSSGQLSVLAISIFISRNIANTSQIFDFIAIDDPIQNMDDINQFSMVDVLSQLDKQLIFSTHDKKFVNLFLKKNDYRLSQFSLYYLDSENNKYENLMANSN